MLEEFAAWTVYSVLGMGEGPLSGALEFFIADTIKVFLLLALMVFAVGIVRTFVTTKKVRKWLGGKKEGIGNVLAALLGVPTPFCSCSAVPLFIGFVEAGVPLGVTFSFLISAPLVNEVALALLFGLFGWEVALLYAGAGLATAVLAGILIGRLGLEKEVEGFVYESTLGKQKEKRFTWGGRVEFAKCQMFNILKKVGPFIILGVGLGALIHGFVPVGFLADIAGEGNPFAVPVAVLLGVPLYSNAAGTIPIVQALMGKGMAIGTALALMMSITALSLPEMVILRKVLKPKLIAIFAGILAVSFLLVGLLFNALLG